MQNEGALNDKHASTAKGIPRSTEGAVRLFLEAVIKELRHVLANISGFLNLFCLIHSK